MKKFLFLALVALIAVMSSCSFESYSGCPAYSHHNKTTKHGQKAQVKYARRN
jgi:hypothetical protein